MTRKRKGDCPVCCAREAIYGFGNICFKCWYEEGFDDVEEYRMEWAVRSGLPPILVGKG